MFKKEDKYKKVKELFGQMQGKQLPASLLGPALNILRDSLPEKFKAEIYSLSENSYTSYKGQIKKISYDFEEHAVKILADDFSFKFYNPSHGNFGMLKLTGKANSIHIYSKEKPSKLEITLLDI
ncbi:MAG: hypothetical protein V1886_02280 [archaeon]